VVSLLAVGCGDDAGDAEAQETETVLIDDSGPALTQEQLDVVVLTPENVGDGWTGGTVESDDDSDSPGCFGEIDAISDTLDPIEVAERDVEYDYGDSGPPQITSGASSYQDGNAVAQAFDDLAAVLRECTTVVGTDDEGGSWDLTVTTDETLSTDTIDDQVDVTATGTYTHASGSEFDVTLHQTFVRIGKNVLTVGVSDFEDQSALHDAYVQIAIDRLVAVIIDSEPSQTTGPQPA
jgi:hypothetical protein